MTVNDQCPHRRHEWLSWLVLAGAFPWYAATFDLNLVPRGLDIYPIKTGFGLFTACFLGLIFVLGRRTTLWRFVVVVGFHRSCRSKSHSLL